MSKYIVNNRCNRLNSQWHYIFSQWLAMFYINNSMSKNILSFQWFFIQFHTDLCDKIRKKQDNHNRPNRSKKSPSKRKVHNKQPSNNLKRSIQKCSNLITNIDQSLSIDLTVVDDFCLCELFISCWRVLQRFVVDDHCYYVFQSDSEVHEMEEVLWEDDSMGYWNCKG